MGRYPAESVHIQVHSRCLSHSPAVPVRSFFCNIGHPKSYIECVRSLHRYHLYVCTAVPATGRRIINTGPKHTFVSLEMHNPSSTSRPDSSIWYQVRIQSRCNVRGTVPIDRSERRDTDISISEIDSKVNSRLIQCVDPIETKKSHTFAAKKSEN